MQTIKVSESSAPLREIPFALVQSSNPTLPATGVTIIAGDLKLSKAGTGATIEFNAAGTWIEKAAGDYRYIPTAGECDTPGMLTGRLIKTSVITFRFEVQIVGFDPYASAGTLTARDLGVRESGTLRSATDTTARLKAGSKTPQLGNTFEITTGALEGASSNVLANSWNAGTETLTLDPPIVGLNGTTPDYRLLTGTAAPTVDKIDVELDAPTRAALITEFYSFIVTTITIPNSAAQKLTAAGALGDPMANAAGGYSAGTLGAKINAIPASPAAISNIPTSGDILAAFKADSEWKTMKALGDGQMTFDPVTGIQVIKDKTGGITRITHTLTLDGQGRVTARVSS